MNGYEERGGVPSITPVDLFLLPNLAPSTPTIIPYILTHPPNPHSIPPTILRPLWLR